MATGKSPVLFTIFGGTGDLTYRKLLPALYNLKATKLMPNNLRILVVGRRDFTNEKYIEHIKPWIEKHARIAFSDNVFNALSEHVEYVKMDFTKTSDYSILHGIYREYPKAQQLYYYAVAPEFFSVISNNLMSCNCMSDQSTHQVLIEKPFGVDVESASQLHKQLLNVFDEESIYRIDHYLGKEMIQNMMAIRFKNTIFKNIWNKESIDYIAISAFETVGVENRGGYYDQTGAIKDMVQNHLFQILSIVLMDEPDENDVDSLFKNQVDIINRLKPIEVDDLAKHILLGQYTAGYDDGEPVVGYQQEQHVEANTKTETFVSMKVCVDHPKYKGVPIYLQTGKRTDQRSTEVLVVFKPVDNQKPNVLTIRISPDEGIYLKFNAKKPGNSQDVIDVSMDFCQSCVYENRVNTPEAYERLLFGAFKQDKSLFTCWSMVLSSWKFIDHLLKSIKQANITPEYYQAGEYGPQQMKQFLPKDYFEYRTQ